MNIETAPTPCPTVHQQEFRIDDRVVESFWVNGTGRWADLGRFTSGTLQAADVIYVGAGREADFEGVDVTGKIVVCDIEFHPSSTATFLEGNPRAFTYDPEGTLDIPRNKYDIYSPNNWPGNYFTAQARGAAGFVGALQNYMDCYNYNEDYTENGEILGADHMAVPAVWISRADGRSVVESIAARGGVGRGRLDVDVEYELKDALNVNGILPGLSPEMILVHSHHDAVFSGAVQDASGVSEVLALAEYFAAQPIEARPKTMMFAATDTHFTDYVGHLAFLEERENAGDKILVDLCIEHVGKEIELADDNSPVETGYIEPRIVYVSDETGLLPVVQAAFEAHGLDRTIFAPVSSDDGGDAEGPYEFRSDEVVSDAYYFAEAGVPVVSLVAGQMYLFHPSDTIDRVPIEHLRPVGLAFAQIATEAHHRL
ncbi:M28 family peptidase [Microbacterium sp. ISL-103]|uniref:M28 family peptidase n=1 Tax=Microbacterium sp. ISL-103 TaxID=2819156 RepID=UPI001BE8610D|nr:M28 family peptidase [Microbacterium sp. ISL-103]MBT2474921.1 M28 family peptidase [Microbacterium sp. ISL-103]